MVEEGEFKKRITEFRETFPEHGIIRPLVDWELLNNWIDEAKKEFPKKRECSRVGGEGEEYNEEYYDAGEVDEFKKKWFGE